jgi:protein-S-isoprenylcysteine O-methyltransferase Ste14
MLSTLLLPMLTVLYAEFAYPQVINCDSLLGISSLPFQSVVSVAGTVMMLIGFCIMAVSVVVLLDRGQGLPAFALTRKLAAKDIYQYTRNPMSLGFYILSGGLGFLSGSTFLTLCALILVIPAHVFYLKFFEEHELEIRFGQSYKEYKKSVPFLIPKFRGRTRITNKQP